jgi:SAM-dependent methyltransferase
MKCKFCGSIEFNKVIADKYWAILCCVNCKIAFTIPQPKARRYQDDDFHSQFGYKKMSELPFQWKSSSELIINTINRILKEGDKILEIGCGEGILLGELSNKFVVIGIEPSIKACHILKKKKIENINGYFPRTTPKGKFDLILVSHVLEHMQDPERVFTTIRDQYHGSYLYLTQTNWLGLIPSLTGKKWYAWVPEDHFWHFSTKGLINYARKFGFIPKELKFSSLIHKSVLSYAYLIHKEFGDQFHLLLKSE